MSIEEKMDMLRRKIKDGALGADDARRALRAEIDGELRKAPADVDMDAVNACEALLAELSGAKEETHAAQNLRAIREKLHPQKRAPVRSAAVAALGENVFADRSIAEEWSAALNLLLDLAASVPVYALACTPDERAVCALEEAMARERREV